MGYEVSGKITDKSSKECLTGATVQVEARIATTEEDGHYHIVECLPIAGHMFMKVSSQGYETFIGKVITNEGDHVTCDCELEPWPAQ